MTIIQSINVFIGQNLEDKKYLYGGVVIILYIVLIQYPSLKSIGIYNATTRIESDSGNIYQAKVAISVVEIEDVSYDNEGDEHVHKAKVYKPETIYWPDGGYTYLDSNGTDYSLKNRSTGTFEMKSGETYSFLIFNKRRFMKIYER